VSSASSEKEVFAPDHSCVTTYVVTQGSEPDPSAADDAAEPVRAQVAS
jgi:hypothetical protein